MPLEIALLRRLFIFEFFFLFVLFVFVFRTSRFLRSVYIFVYYIYFFAFYKTIKYGYGINIFPFCRLSLTALTGFVLYSNITVAWGPIYSLLILLPALLVFFPQGCVLWQCTQGCSPFLFYQVLCVFFILSLLSTWSR